MSCASLLLSLVICRASAGRTRHRPSAAEPSDGAGAEHIRVAIATLVAPNDQAPCKHGYGCALLPWCVSARGLRAALRPSFAHVDVLVIVPPEAREGKKGTPRHAARLESGQRPGRRLSKGNGTGASRRQGQPATQTCLMTAATETFDPADCPGVKLIYASHALQQASQRHAERVIEGGVMSYNRPYISRGQVFLWKWELWQLGARYDAILYADLDVFVSTPGAFEPHRVAGQWAATVPRLVAHARAGELEMMSFADTTTPVNGGVFWVFPPRDGGKLYREGLGVLRAPWNATHGWELAGPLRSLAFARDATHWRRVWGGVRRGMVASPVSWLGNKAGALLSALAPYIDHLLSGADSALASYRRALSATGQRWTSAILTRGSFCTCSSSGGAAQGAWAAWGPPTLTALTACCTSTAAGASRGGEYWPTRSKRPPSGAQPSPGTPSRLSCGTPTCARRGLSTRPGGWRTHPRPAGRLTRRRCPS